MRVGYPFTLLLLTHLEKRGLATVSYSQKQQSWLYVVDVICPTPLILRVPTSLLNISWISRSGSTELLPLIKSYYLKEAIQYSQKVKSGKCFAIYVLGILKIISISECAQLSYPVTLASN